VTAEEERAAFAYFTKHADKRYSFVDCTSFVLMEKLGISVAWSVDDDFTHRFTAVPGPIA
jgi:predicted nucleic acid-binding protein